VAAARDPWTGVLDDLAAGDADIVLGGVWVPAMYAGMGRELVSIGQLNARFPMVVVTREPVEDFNWEWLTGRTVLVPGAGGTAPYEFTAGVMREHGFDPAGVKFVRDLSTAMLRELYEHGLGDAMIADPLTAQELCLTGHGHPAVRLAEVAGPMPNSVYYTDPSRIDDLRERLVALMAGVGEAMAALTAGADPAPVIDADWPGGPRQALIATAIELAANGTWSGIAIEPEPLDRWARILSDRGLAGRHATFEELVDPSIAEAAAAEVEAAVSGTSGAAT
jgi:NitT/TauT family transport system substrate-binding protein